MFLRSLLALFLWPLSPYAADSGSLFQVDVAALEKEGLKQQVLTFADGAALSQSHVWAELDGVGFVDRKSPLTAAKWAVVLTRPAGFFNEQRMSHPTWIRGFFPDLKLRPIGENLFESEDGKTKVEIFFDSDDMSNLRPRRLVHAVARSRMLDPIAQGAFASFVVWRHGGDADELAIFNVVPLQARKTLLVGYGLWVGEKGREGATKALPARAKMAQELQLD